jgi:hypothetical protein
VERRRELHRALSATPNDPGLATTHVASITERPATSTQRTRARTPCDVITNDVASPSTTKFASNLQRPATSTQRTRARTPCAVITNDVASPSTTLPRRTLHRGEFASAIPGVWGALGLPPSGGLGISPTGSRGGALGCGFSKGPQSGPWTGCGPRRPTVTDLPLPPASPIRRIARSSRSPKRWRHL